MIMEILRTKSELVAWREAARGRVALVATMGAFHRGHVALMDKAREVADSVVVSIFVNPLQFGPTEDYLRYPRDLERDARVAAEQGVDAVFAPSVDEMYPRPQETFVYWPNLGSVLCGRTRPDHFRGVGTVLMKLFHLARPHVAPFGRKDGQQALLAQRMVRELDMDLEVIVVPTVREPDGLAMSSRNAYLSPEDRAQALGLFAGLSCAKGLIENGERRAAAIRNEMAQVMARYPGLGVEYAEVVSRESLKPVDLVDATSMVAVAGRVGTTRLIDNLWVVEGQGGLAVEL